MVRRNTPPRIARRTYLSGIAGGVAALSGISAGAAASATGDGPATEWRRQYLDDGSYDVSLQDVVQTDDGGYAMAGDGVEVDQTGPGHDVFALLKAGPDGDREWVTLADDDTDETTELSFGDLAQTSDGGYAVVGHADNPTEGVDDRVGGKVAEAVKFTADGDLAWLTRLNAFEDDESSDGSDAGYADNALFLSTTPTGDGGILAGGTFEGSAWLVSLDASGAVRWERHYDGFGVVTLLGREDGGIRAIVDRDEGHVALDLDATGAIEGTTPLSVDRTQTPYNQVFTWAPDGGYAYTGRDADPQNMVLGKLDDSGDPVWREEYDGPYGEDDRAHVVLATSDGGYVLGGYMRDVPDGTFTPTILRTDADGTEQWRHLFTETGASNVASVVETTDSGYAVLFSSASNTLAKLAPDGESGQGDADVPQVAGTTPTDIDGDGLYEDVDGDGDGDIFDALTYYNERDSDAISSNPQYFDFDGDGDSGDLFDALALYNDVR